MYETLSYQCMRPNLLVCGALSLHLKELQSSGTFANGTTWREKWLEKPYDGFFEKTAWWSDGTILGEALSY